MSEISVSDTILERLRAATRVMALTGAGVSAESGVPTFRGADGSGFWGRYDPMELASLTGYLRNPQRGWAWYAMRRSQLQRVRPNPAHRALADLGAFYPTFTLVTQNVDGLHTLAGSREVLELHGSLARTKCLREDRVVAYESPTDASAITEEAMERGEWPEVPTCPDCGGPLRPDVVWFGEALPEGVFEQAEAAARVCQVCFIVGTSAQVYPAANLPVTARAHGALLVEINPEATDLTPQVDLSLRGPAGVTLPALAALIRRQG